MLGKFGVLEVVLARVLLLIPFQARPPRSTLASNPSSTPSFPSALPQSMPPIWPKCAPLNMRNFYASSSPLFNTCGPCSLDKRSLVAQVCAPHAHKHLAKCFETSKLLIEAFAKKLPTSKHQLIMFPNKPHALERTMISARMFQSCCH